MPEDDKSHSKWLPVIAKALCLISMHYAKMDDKPLLKKIDFLEQLGLGSADAAHVVGSSVDSVGVLRRRAKNKGGKNGSKKKKKGR